MPEAILVADDEPGVRESLAEVLRDAGYVAQTAADGTAALQLLDQHDFAIVVTDLRMPGADGLTVLKRAREISPQTLVLVMTAHGTVETAVEALRAGATDYILKPVLFDDLLAKVARLLEPTEDDLRLRAALRGSQPDIDRYFGVGDGTVLARVMRAVIASGIVPSAIAGRIRCLVASQRASQLSVRIASRT